MLYICDLTLIKMMNWTELTSRPGAPFFNMAYL